jgi:osmotically-inducible protein OsmY
MIKTALKVLALIACLSALPLMVGLMGCVGDGHSQGSGQLVEDSRTAERVREALATGADYKYDEVKVVAHNGVVELSGFVNTTAQKRAAGAAAAKVIGVKDIVNDLAVKE